MTFDGAKRGICFLFVFSKKQPAVAASLRPARQGALRRAILTTPLADSVRMDSDIKN